MTRPLMLCLLPDGPERSFDGDRPVVIGRDNGADVVVGDPRASRRHALIRADGNGGWVLEDTSRGGTFCAGARVSRLALVEPVVVRLGHPTDGPQLRLRTTVSRPVPPAGDPPPPPAPPRPAVPRPGPAQPEGPEPPRPARPGPDGPDLGPLSRVYEPRPVLRIGRADDNDIVVPDLLASRHHAELRAVAGGRHEIVDLASHNGVFVNGRRIARRAPVPDGGIVSVGHHLYRLCGHRLEEYIDSGSVSFAALDLVVRAEGRALVDGVSFSLEAGQFLAVLGPTGAGKSTLLRALIGSHPADEGQVLYNGRDVYAGFAELRNRIGYVPQDDLLHSQLTVREALRYAARLRFPPDVAEAERSHRVDEVMAELGLSQRADLVVSRLSGGQRKRTSVAIELLTRPSLLVLDEPTSGLDPGYEKSVMDLLRSLADGSRTVITVTHSIQSLDRCDRILFLAPGGQTAFFGPPDETLGYFGQADYADVFQALDRAPAGVAKAAFEGSPADERYVQAPVAWRRARPAPVPEPGPVAVQAHWGPQFATLVRRYLSVIVADRRNTALLVLQAPVLGLLMLAVLGRRDLDVTNPAARTTASTVLVALVLAATYLGASNSIREIVKERTILTRERAIGVSPSAYVLSKAVVLGALTVLQSIILVTVGTLRQGGPGHGAVLASGRLELLVVVVLTGLASMGLGLLISALVSNPDKALTVLPVILFAQFLLTGAVFNLSHSPGLDQIGYLSSARWGYSAAASTTDLDQIQREGCNGTAVVGRAPSRSEAACQGSDRHSSGVWLFDVSMLVTLTGVTLVGAGLAVRPLGQPRRS
jgi:ABC transport system ATP-binding/permease protein